MPTINCTVHESVFQSYHILSKVEEMLARGDSKETIIELISFIRDESSRRTEKALRL